MEGMEGEGGESGRGGALEKLANKLTAFISDYRSMRTHQYVSALIQLCHDNTLLASTVWVDLFPKLWVALTERHRQVC